MVLRECVCLAPCVCCTGQSREIHPGSCGLCVFVDGVSRRNCLKRDVQVRCLALKAPAYDKAEYYALPGASHGTVLPCTMIAGGHAGGALSSGQNMWDPLTAAWVRQWCWCVRMCRPACAHVCSSCGCPMRSVAKTYIVRLLATRGLSDSQLPCEGHTLSVLYASDRYSDHLL
jgi:hypothetical protein